MQSTQDKLLVVGGQHGNEPFGARLIKDMESDFAGSQGIKMIVANPRALQKNVRYIEENMNQAYSSIKNTYEAKRANMIAEQAAMHQFLIDLHTTTSEIPPTLIVADLSHATLQIINSLPFEHIVYFDHFLSANSLIGEHRGSVTFEAPTHYAESHYTNLKGVFYKGFRSLLASERHAPKKRSLYFASEQLSKHDDVPKDVVNFSKLKGKDYQTFLAQEEAYAGRYLGFKLTQPVAIEV